MTQNRRVAWAQALTPTGSPMSNIWHAFALPNTPSIATYHLAGCGVHFSRLGPRQEAPPSAAEGVPCRDCKMRLATN